MTLFKEMKDNIYFPRAMFRGHYMKSVAQMELNGIPIDTENFEKLKVNWNFVIRKMIAEVNKDFSVYEGTVFKQSLFKEMSKLYPQLEPLKDLRISLGQLKLNDLAVGQDGRNRCLISPFASKTGRNQPSNSKFIFGLPSWLRHLIKPNEGMSLAYIDYSQQEIGIAASLSNDEKMMEAYESGDFYLTFAKMARAVPENATKKSHSIIRNQFKECVLGVLYGMQEYSLSKKIGCAEYEAKELIKLHKSTFKQFWAWIEEVSHYGQLGGSLMTEFGWPLHTSTYMKASTLRNYPMQANGAEILRLACGFINEFRITICAPVHDAILIEAPTEKIEGCIDIAQQQMQRASRIVLEKLELRTDVDRIDFPQRFQPEKGKAMWEKVCKILENTDQPVQIADTPCYPTNTPVQSY